MADVKMSSMSADTSVSGDEKLLALDGTTSKTITTAAMAAYAVDTIGVATAAALASGDYVLCSTSSGSVKRVAVDSVADHANDLAWSAASANTQPTGGDYVLSYQGGSVVKTSLTSVTALVLSGVQATTLDISALADATLGGTDRLLVVQGSTPKKTTVSDLETQFWADMATYVAGLSAVTVSADADVFYCIQGGTAKCVTATVLATYMAAEAGDTIVNSAWSASAVTPADAADVLIVQRSGVLKTLRVDGVLSYVDATFAASSQVSPVASTDLVPLYRSGVRKLATAANAAAYIVGVTWTADEIASALSTDVMLVQRSGVNKTLTLANLQTLLLATVQADSLNLSGLSSATLGGTDYLLVCQSTTAKQTTVAGLEAHAHAAFATYTAGLSAVSSLAAGDKFYVLQSSSPKYCTSADVATYLLASAWSSSAVTSAAGSDYLLTYRGSTTNKITVDNLATYVLTGAQATILNVSGLTTATVTSADAMLVCQSGTAKTATVAAIAAEVHTELAAYVAGLSAASVINDADNVYLVQAGVPVKTTVVELAQRVLSGATDFPWSVIATSRYTATPASTSQITMSDTTGLVPGLPIRYTYNSVTYYGIVGTVAGNASITIVGAPLNISYDLTELCVAPASQVVTKDVIVQRAVWGSAAADILSAVELTYFRWRQSTAYLVSFSAAQQTVDTGASQPKLNVKLNGQLVSTTDSNKGIQASGSVGAWVENAAVAINTSYYEIERGEAIELRCTEAGSNGDAKYLAVNLVFVLA